MTDVTLPAVRGEQIEEAARRLVDALPDDGATVRLVLDGVVMVGLYRCRRKSGGQRLEVPSLGLTGGVQMYAGGVWGNIWFDARLRPGWTREQAVRRLETLLDKALRHQRLILARATVENLVALAGFAGEMALAEADLPEIDEMDVSEAARAIGVLAGVLESTGGL